MFTEKFARVVFLSFAIGFTVVAICAAPFTFSLSCIVTAPFIFFFIKMAQQCKQMIECYKFMDELKKEELVQKLQKNGMDEKG